MRTDKMIAHRTTEMIQTCDGAKRWMKTCPSMRATLHEHIQEIMSLWTYPHKDFLSWNSNPNISPPLVLSEVINHIENNSI